MQRAAAGVWRPLAMSDRRLPATRASWCHPGFKSSRSPFHVSAVTMSGRSPLDAVRVGGLRNPSSSAANDDYRIAVFGGEVQILFAHGVKG